MGNRPPIWLGAGPLGEEFLKHTPLNGEETQSHTALRRPPLNNPFFREILENGQRERKKGKQEHNALSPTAVLKLRRLARKVARGSVDRTAYCPSTRSLSCPTMQRAHISLSVVRGVNRAIRSHSPGNPVCTFSRAREQGQPLYARAPGPK